MEEITSYNLKDLAELEWKHPLTIKANYKYIPIRFTSPTITKRYEQGKQKKPYAIKYIRVEDIQKLLKWKIDFIYYWKNKWSQS